MAAGLDNIINTYGAVVQAAGFALLPLGTKVRDQAAQNKKWYQLNLHEGPDLGPAHGMTVVDYDVVLELELHWNPELDTAILSTTVANDVEALSDAMIKVSNRPAEVLIVQLVNGSRLDRSKPDDWLWAGLFRINYRRTKDLT